MNPLVQTAAAAVSLNLTWLADWLSSWLAG